MSLELKPISLLNQRKTLGAYTIYRHCLEYSKLIVKLNRNMPRNVASNLGNHMCDLSFQLVIEFKLAMRAKDDPKLQLSRIEDLMYTIEESMSYVEMAYDLQLMTAPVVSRISSEITAVSRDTEKWYSSLLTRQS